MASVLDRLFTMVKAKFVRAKTNTMPEAAEHPAPKIVPLDEQRLSREDALGGHSMAAEENKALARRGFELWNSGDLAASVELIADDYVLHDPAAPGIRGHDGYKQFFTLYHTAFPDTHLGIEDLVAEGDRAVVRWTATGTHRGELQGIPPTGKQVTVTGITIYRIAGGKIVEQSQNWDTLGLMQQLGVVPAQGQAVG